VGTGAGDDSEYHHHASRHRPRALDAKKKSLRASAQDLVTHAAWWATVKMVKAEDLVFVDESSATIRLTRRYARAPRGIRAVGQVPRNHGRATTLVVALSRTGLHASQTCVGAVNGSTFLASVRDVRCPTLRPGQVVMLDNLSVHTGAAVAQAITAVGGTVPCLPPSSPDFAPIELAFAQVKAAIRAAAARTHDALDAAIASALTRVTAQGARNYFLHCGYSLAQ